MKKAFILCLSLLLLILSGCTTALDARKEEGANQSAAESEITNEPSDGVNQPQNNSQKSSGSFEGTYTGDGVTITVTDTGNGTYYIEVRDVFHDYLDGTLEGNVIIMERVINTDMMPEASNPYDEQTTITLSKGTATDGAINNEVLLYHRDSVFYFPLLKGENGENGLTRKESKDATLHKKTKTS